MKKKYGYFISVLVLLLVGLLICYQFSRQDDKVIKKQNPIAYIDEQASKPKVKSTEAKSMDQISAEEGISAEQIVVKITDQSYVTSHGDHFHFYNGKVPYDALISEELLMTDPNYNFNSSDAISEIHEATIIKVGDAYAVYISADSDRKNIRTKIEIAQEVAKGNR